MMSLSLGADVETLTMMSLSLGADVDNDVTVIGGRR